MSEAIEYLERKVELLREEVRELQDPTPLTLHKLAPLFSSASGEWSTPQDLFDELNQEFHFVLDAAATPENAKCLLFLTKEDDALDVNCDWGFRSGGKAIWLNPPYGRGIVTWIEKAYVTALTGTTVVMLLPARTDTKWFHEYVYTNEFADYRFVKGRLKFGGSKNSAPFPSVIVIFHGRAPVQEVK